MGIAVECVDGGILENVRVSGIRMTRCCQTPILVRLGRRREHPDGCASFLRNVVIENVTGESASLLASSITGVPGTPEENESFNVAVVQEYTPVRYHEDGTPYADWNNTYASEGGN